MAVVSVAAVLRAVVMIIDRRRRAIPYCVRLEISEDEQPYTVYFERMRTVEGLILCGIGLYQISKICDYPIYTFNGSFIWYLILGFVFLALGLPLCFICSGGCAVVTGKRVIIYRTHCFFPRTLTAIPRSDIQCACRTSAGKKGTIGAFFSCLSALIKGDKEKCEDMRDAAFLSGCLEVRTESSSYRIRLSGSHADDALNDIGALCQSESEGGEKIDRKYSVATPIACAVIAFAAVLTFGITLTAEARKTVEQQYVSAVYLEDTGAYSQAYVEFEHLSELYNYRDSEFRAGYCYARLEMSQGEYARAADRIAKLPDFEEKNELLYNCAIALSEEESAALAADIFAQLDGYEDSAERLAQIDDVYNMSVASYESGDYLTAAEGFSILRDYKETAEYVSLLAEEADKLVPNTGNPENLNSKQILERCNEALPLLEILSWDSQCAQLKTLCEEYISIYTFD